MNPQPNRNRPGGYNGSSFVMGFGIFPTLFSLNFSWDDIVGANNVNRGNNREGNRED
jgi:hypothetical protein